MTPAIIILRPKRYLKFLLLQLFIFANGYFLLENATEVLPVSVIVMTGFAVVIHITNFILRDTEYDALCVDCDLTNKDILARSSMLIYDALLLAGLLTGASLLLNWTWYLYFGAAIFVCVPIYVIWQSRHTYRPDATQPRFAPNHFLPPLFLAVLVAYLSLTESFLAPTSPQPFAVMVLLSTIATGLRKQTTFHGFADKLRYACFAATAILLIWNYTQIG